MQRYVVEQKAGYLRDAIFAANDGIVTTFAVVAGSKGAALASNVVLIMGFANLFADSFSMASGNYLGTKSEIEYEEARGGSLHKLTSPLKQGIVTFISFNIAGLLPILPYVFNLREKFIISVIIVGLSLIAIGTVKGAYAKRSILKSAVEMLLVGGFASFVAYSVGYLINRYIL